MEGCTPWFTGLSGAGKIDHGRHRRGRLKARGARSRCSTATSCARNLSKGLGFSREDRDTNIARIAFVADLLARNGVPVITAAISPYARNPRRGPDADRATGSSRSTSQPRSTSACARHQGPVRQGALGEIKEFTGVSDPYEAPPTRRSRSTTERETAERVGCAGLRVLGANGFLAEVAAARPGAVA